MCFIEGWVLPAVGLEPAILSPPHHRDQARTAQTRQLHLTCPRCAVQPLCVAATTSEMSAGSEGMERMCAKCCLAVLKLDELLFTSFSYRLLLDFSLFDVSFLYFSKNEHPCVVVEKIFRFLFNTK